MLTRVGLLIAAFVAAYIVSQIKIRSSMSPDSSLNPTENGEANTEKNQNKEQEKETLHVFNDGSKEEEIEQKEEEEEVKLISGELNPPGGNAYDIGEDKFEELLSGKVEFPLPDNEFDAEKRSKTERDRIYDAEITNNASELERLRKIVKELEEREVRLEGELLDQYYGLKQQESDITELQRQLKIKTVEIDKLKITISSLQTERKKLLEDIEVEASRRKELEVARNKVKELQGQIQMKANMTKGQLLLLKQQVSDLKAKEEEAYKRDFEVEKRFKGAKQLEVELVELKRNNVELLHENRDLLVKLDAAEAKAAALSNLTETELVAKAREEVNELRHANEDLLKQVEGLQMNRFSEVEELVYLRWVNACLRYELRDYQTPAGKMSARELNNNLSPKSQEKAKQLLLEYAGCERGQGDTDLDSNFSQTSSPGSEDFDNDSIDSSMSKYSSLSRKSSLIQKFKTWGKNKDDSSILSSPRSSSSISQRRKGPLETLMLRNAGDILSSPDQTPNLPRIRTRNLSSDSLNSVATSFQLMSKSVEGVLHEKYPAYKDRHELALEREKQIKEKAEKARAERFGDKSNLSKILPPKLAQNGESSEQSSDNKTVDLPIASKMKPAQIEKRPPRVSRPPPKPSGGNASGGNVNGLGRVLSGTPPPRPPPPPPPRAPPPGVLSKGAGNGDKVHRAPEVVEFYQSLMKHEAKKDATTLTSTISSTADSGSSMIGEIENRSSFLLAVKADVETQGEFVQSLATEVRAAHFTDVEDLVAFVNWLDEELSFLVDESAVLKHFDWPKGKADALREAAFEHQYLVKLEKQVSSYEDDPSIPCAKALKKMYSLLEKVEQSVYALLLTRDMAISRYREFGIPVNWLMDTGVVGKIKLSSIQLAKKYMKRVSTELDVVSGTEKEANREFLLLQGIRFAFRVHQFAGGFDAESMKAFEDLRSRVHTQISEDDKLQM